ncbi:loricrin-like [Saccostrea cucullata]|uniref:loricrin-like n=1 Tax=Saccostrea cuccullata TaxID=36930 RepID=UPI002ED568F0
MCSIPQCGSSSGSPGSVIMNVLTGGSGYISGGPGFSSVGGGGSRGGGGRTPYGISGGSTVYSNGRVVGMSGSGSAYCPPMRHDCHPSCIKYDDPHCRRCLC